VAICAWIQHQRKMHVRLIYLKREILLFAHRCDHYSTQIALSSRTLDPIASYFICRCSSSIQCLVSRISSSHHDHNHRHSIVHSGERITAVEIMDSSRFLPWNYLASTYSISYKGSVQPHGMSTSRSEMRQGYAENMSSVQFDCTSTAT